MKNILIIVILLLTAFLVGCASQTTEVVKPLTLLESALEVTQLLEAQNFEALEAWIHPEKGVRFSPYGYVDLEKDLVIEKGQLTIKSKDTKVYNWGLYDGSGEPIELSFMDYYETFVYDVDFLNPEVIGINTLIGMGNTYVNISEVYPNAEFVELHFNGIDPQYEGIDWRSLYLIFEKVDSTWKLIAITHGQWTI